MASYVRPCRLRDALALLGERKWAVLAGGTDHFPARAAWTPEEDILDIGGIEGLRAIGREGDTWRIPALATWTGLVDTPLPRVFDGLKQAARQVGGRQIQNAGTVVGNVCNASPAADGIPALLALDARVELRSAAGTRTMALETFVLGPRRTARRADEMVTALLVPDSGAGSVFLKLGGRAYLVISISMVALTLRLDVAGRVDRAAVAVGACGPAAVRLPGLEAALLGQIPAAGLVEASHLGPLAPIDDLRAPAAYRLEATLELLRRGVASFGRLREAA